jgi:hypothetical protein
MAVCVHIHNIHGHFYYLSKNIISLRIEKPRLKIDFCIKTFLFMYQNNSPTMDGEELYVSSGLLL